MNSSEERFVQLAETAVQRFGLPADCELELLKYRENAVFRVQPRGSEERWALRIHREGYQSEEAVRSELLWMDALRAAGVQTPEPRPGLGGDPVQVVLPKDGPAAPHLCDLLSWVNGSQLDEDWSPETLRMLGALNARMHRQSGEWRMPPGFHRHRWDEAGLIGERCIWGDYHDLAILDRGQIDLLDRARESVEARLGAFGKGGDRFGLIHADLMPENVLLQEGEPFVIDFDDSGFGWFLYDLATLLAFEIAEDDFEKRQAAWVEGYRSERELPDEHLEMLPILIMCRFLAGLGWLHSRRETEMAREYGGPLSELACVHAESVLAS